MYSINLLPKCSQTEDFKCNLASELCCFKAAFLTQVLNLNISFSVSPLRGRDYSKQTSMDCEGNCFVPISCWGF